jgi:SAM-dependent MidA family methyltransferase
VTELADHLVAEIDRGGPITFAEYMHAALYHPNYGYYSSERARTGRAGDFVTSPEIDPAFGELWAEAFRRAWEACDNPNSFHVVEVGPGEGGFAHSVLEASDGRFGEALRYVLVEPRDASRARQRSIISDPRAEWAPKIAHLSVGSGCVFANEVLDNQPVHLLRSGTDGWNEVYVTATPNGLDLVDGTVSSPEVPRYLKEVGCDPPAGLMQVGIAAVELAERAARAIGRGLLYFVDYGLEANEIAARGGNTVVTYSDRGPKTDPLYEPGRADVTAHVDWTGVRTYLERAGMRVDGPLLQADVLRSLGLATIDARLRNEHDNAVAAGDGAAAVRLLSRRNAVGTLTNTAGLGGLQVLAASKELDVAPASLLIES